MDFDVEECDVDMEFGQWRSSRRGGLKDTTRKVRIGIRTKSNKQGEVVINYLDSKYPRACGTVVLTLHDLKMLIQRFEIDTNDVYGD